MRRNEQTLAAGFSPVGAPIVEPIEDKSVSDDGSRPEAAERPEKALRVALVTGSYNYIREGAAMTLNRLVGYLERHGVEVLVFAPVGREPAFAHQGTLAPVPSIPLPLRPEYRLALGCPPSVTRRLAAFRPDLVHIATPDLLGYHVLRLALRWKVPVVASYHSRLDTYIEHYGLGLLTPIFQRYLKHFFNSCRQVYVPSESMAEVLRAEGLKSDMRLWGRGVDTQRFSPAKRSAAWRARHGLGEGDLVVAYVSRLVREKGLRTLIAVSRELRRSGVAHQVLIVGDGPERAMLERELPEAVFTGLLEGENLAHAYASSDVFLFPSVTETFGNVTLEAMASGVAAVCADATGSRSLVVPGVTGFLARPDGIDEFVGHILTLANDPALRRRMGAAGRERSLGFDWDEPMARMLGYYEEVLRSAAGPPRAAA